MSFINKAYKDFLFHQREVCLYFDLNYIEQRLHFLKSLSNESVQFLFPVKSFPAPEVLKLASEISNGFDISNEIEFNLIKKVLSSEHVLWSSSPFIWDYTHSHTIYFDVQSIRSKTEPKLIRSLRLNGDFLNDDLQSRFGVDVQYLKSEELASFKAIHLHHGSEKMSLYLFKKVILKVKELIGDLDTLSHVNLGGGFTTLTEIEIKELVSFAQTELVGKKIIFEPGRWIAREAGHCFGVLKEIIQRETKTILISTISRDCHLKWLEGNTHLGFFEGNQVREKVRGEVLLTGPTCYEGDKVLNIKNFDKNLSIGDTIYVSGISGYSFSWNHSFNGILKADIVFIK